MRKATITLLATLLLAVPVPSAHAAGGPRMPADITYIGAWMQTEDELGWVVRAVGVGGSYGVVIEVAYRLADGSLATMPPATLRFFSGAGNAEWGTEHYDTAVPADASVVFADVTLILLKKPTVALDVQHGERMLGPDFIGNLYCNPLRYPTCA